MAIFSTYKLPDGGVSPMPPSTPVFCIATRRDSNQLITINNRLVLQGHRKEHWHIQRVYTATDDGGVHYW